MNIYQYIGWIKNNGIQFLKSSLGFCNYILWQSFIGIEDYIFMEEYDEVQNFYRGQIDV